MPSLAHMTLPEDNLHAPKHPCPEGQDPHALAGPEILFASIAEERREVTGDRGSSFDYFSCEEAIKRLNDYLDSELNPAEKEDVMRHLKVCQPCLERFHFQKVLIISLREKMRHVIAPTTLKDKLSALMKPGK
jgi:anti-sigma factor (TIGR02949 family)